jgi:hypothetical protein
MFLPRPVLRILIQNPVHSALFTRVLSIPPAQTILDQGEVHVPLVLQDRTHDPLAAVPLILVHHDMVDVDEIGQGLLRLGAPRLLTLRAVDSGKADLVLGVCRIEQH